MKPAPDGGVVPECRRAPVRREHGLLQDVIGVLGTRRRRACQPVEPRAVPGEQFLEGVPVTGRVCGEQL